MRKGGITAFLSLIFILILSMTGAVIESASIQVTKNKKRGDMDRAMESVFAEYQKELLDEYDVFALEGTYETGEYSEDKLLNRLTVYGADHMEQNVDKIQLLTDDGGRAFREQVIAYMKHKMGIAQLEELTDSSSKWKEQEEKSQQYEEKERETAGDLEASLAESETELPEEENPIRTISEIKKAGLVNVVVRDPSAISNKHISVEAMPSRRSLQKGRGVFKIRGDTENAVSGLYLGAYQLEKFSSAVQPHEEGKLSYELEYLIGGKGSDRDNLEKVLRELAAVRFAVNYAYLMTDEVKKSEAGAMALTMAGIVALPALTEVIKQGILLAWAFGEAVMELRSLLKGGKIELVKTRESWQLQLSNLLKLGTGNDVSDGMHSDKGLSYQDYLRILLFTKSQEESAMRSLDVIEMNMRMKKGEFFRVDRCISKLEIKSRCEIRRGISYEFKTLYGYQ